MATDGCIHDGWLLLRDQSPLLDQDFLYNILGSDRVFTQFKQAATGGVVNNLNSEIVRGVKIPLPPLEVQKEIVAEIEGYQKVINGARAVLDNYRPHIPIHPDWPMVSIGEACDIYNGSTPSRKEASYWENGTVPWFTVDDIRKSGRIIRETIQSVTKKALAETSLKLLPTNSVLLCCTASVGEHAFTEIEVTTNQQFNGLVVKKDFSDRLLPKFLFHLSVQFKDELLRLSGKTSFNFVSGGTLKTISFPLPSLATQQAIVAEIEAEQALVAANRELITRFEKKIQATLARIWGEEALSA
jgi:type I restriction enzyme M protein